MQHARHLGGNWWARQGSSPALPQDGSYLAEFLLEMGYEVHGIKRRASLFYTERVDHIYQDPHTPNGHFILHYGDLTDASNPTGIINKVHRRTDAGSVTAEELELSGAAIRVDTERPEFL